jgi:hypothetical protein
MISLLCHRTDMTGSNQFHRVPGYTSTVFALKFGYCLDGEKATLMSASDDIRILAHEKARGD